MFGHFQCIKISLLCLSGISSGVYRCLLPLFLSLSSTYKMSVCIFFLGCHQVFIMLIAQLSLNFPFSSLSRPSFPSLSMCSVLLSMQQMLQYLNRLCGPSLALSSHVHVSPCTGELRTRHSTKMCYKTSD